VYEKPESPDIPLCTRIEIEFRPSMLEYYFPYAGQQNLLSASEQQTLRSLRSLIVDDQDQAHAFVNDINEMAIIDGVVRQRSLAHVVCYRGDELLTSFDVFDDNCIVTDVCNRYVHPEGLCIIRKLTLQIEPFELRVQCGGNLRNFWHRLRLYHKAGGQIRVLYPAPVEWCDAMARVYIKTGLYNESFTEAYICPATNEGKCHYAMNPNCKPDSPADTVLLFETKAGWNQHGGPELFTFDNHDPRGGCVLLNDGTVKFIHTTEEIRQLRWK
jgi:hypothetical protein